MRFTFFVVTLLVCATGLACAQSSSQWVETKTVNCCIRSVAMDTPPDCKQLGALDCQNAGGKAVSDCSKCAASKDD